MLSALHNVLVAALTASAALIRPGRHLVNDALDEVPDSERG